MQLSGQERARLAAIENALAVDDPRLAERLSSGWHRRGVLCRGLWIGSLFALGLAPLSGAAAVALHSLLFVGAAGFALLAGLAGIVALCLP